MELDLNTLLVYLGDTLARYRGLGIASLIVALVALVIDIARDR